MESAFFGRQRIGHFEAAEDGVIAVDDGEVNVRQGADKLCRFDFIHHKQADARKRQLFGILRHGETD